MLVSLAVENVLAVRFPLHPKTLPRVDVSFVQKLLS